MRPVEVIIEAHRAGEINLVKSVRSKVAKKYNCSESTVTAAKKKLGIIKDPAWKNLLEAYGRGEVDLVNWSFGEIGRKFGCSYDTVIRAIHKGKVPRPVADEEERKADAIARQNRKLFRDRWGVLDRWGVIPERVGKTPREWRRYVKTELDIAA